jgi:hypothetical protein
MKLYAQIAAAIVTAYVVIKILDSAALMLWVFL